MWTGSPLNKSLLALVTPCNNTNLSKFKCRYAIRYRQARAYTHSHVQTLTYRLNSLNIYGKSSQGYPFTAPFEPKLHSMVAHCLALWGVEPMICSLVRTQLAFFTSGFDSPLSPVRPIMIICGTQSAVRECEDLQADLETTL